MDIEDLEPQKQPKKPKDLEVMGIEELEDYLAALRAEAQRVEAQIEAKKSYLQSAAAFFKS
jgi:uncharacterized small protein (DUF1192 family)